MCIRDRADRDVVDVVARDDRGIGSLVDVHGQLLLARGEAIAHGVGDALLLHVLAVFDLRAHRLVGERIEAREFELARLADGGQGLLGVG